jgi:predicted DCC family thiol-disulfide oxidoreductase YuxK
MMAEDRYRTGNARDARNRAPGLSRTILFDGVCNLCNGFVQFIIKRDRRDRFRFGALQSKAATAMLEGRMPYMEVMSTIIYVRGEHVMARSTAALNILKDLGGPWALTYLLMVIPGPLRDRIYDWVAKNRYRWFGKRESCMLPTPELKAKFIDREEGLVR